MDSITKALDQMSSSTAVVAGIASGLSLFLVEYTVKAILTKFWPKKMDSTESTPKEDAT